MRDGSVQLNVAYGNGPTDLSVDSPTGIFDHESNLEGGYLLSEMYRTPDDAPVNQPHVSYYVPNIVSGKNRGYLVELDYTHYAETRDAVIGNGMYFDGHHGRNESGIKLPKGTLPIHPYSNFTLAA